MIRVGTLLCWLKSECATLQILNRCHVIRRQLWTSVKRASMDVMNLYCTFKLDKTLIMQCVRQNTTLTFIPFYTVCKTAYNSVYLST